VKDVILLNNLFNGEYIKEKVGGEIINMYQADNDKFYIYVNPYGNVNKRWDDRIKYVLFIRSVGNGVVKVIGKAEIREQIPRNAVRKIGEGIDYEQEKYIDENKITYGNIKIYELGSWSNFYVTYEAEGIVKAQKDIYLATDASLNHPENSTFVLQGIAKINNQSQKLYIEPSDDNYEIIEEIINTPDLWEEHHVGKVNIHESELNEESFLSIIKKENDELVNSNLLSHFLEKSEVFWSDFVQNVLEISDMKVINGKPKITSELIGNIDLFIEVDNSTIIIENKIKSGINGQRGDGYSQLEKYVQIAREYYDNPERNLFFYVLRPDYNNEDYSVFNEGSLYKEIKYSAINEIIKDRRIGSYFEEFKKVVKKHSAEYDNELFELMNERFLGQIKSMQQ
jgi:hypothetical protein